MDKKRHGFQGNIPLLIAEICVLVISIGIMHAVITMTGEVNHKSIDEEKIRMNEEVVRKKTTVTKKTEAAKVELKEEEKSKGYRNIALFGVDARDGQLGRGTRSDTVMIASINQDTQEIRLISVFRDTYLNLGNDTYNKCNTAYAQGGPEQAINMLNMNLDLDITDYVTVGFSGLIDAVDALGGVEMEVTEAEITHLNNYQLCMAEELGVDYTPVKKSGRQYLNGMQATAYCRIRYTRGDDFRRTERQRAVLAAMMEKAGSASVSTLTNVVNSVLPQIETSLDVDEILSVLGSAAGYHMAASDGFPFEGGRAGANVGSKGSCVIPTDLEENVRQLHHMLYPKESYVPSAEVRQISREIREQTEAYLQ